MAAEVRRLQPTVLVGRQPAPLPWTTLPDVFRQVVVSNGSGVALIRQNGQTMTFTDLDKVASRLSNSLLRFVNQCVSTDPSQKGVGAIIIGMTPGVERIIAILALWKIGAYYVPVEACLPKHRIKMIIREVKPSMILTCDQLRHRFEEAEVFAEGVNAVKTYTDIMNFASHDSASLNVPDIDGSRPACILYTSGSTGQPKGVILTHGNIINRLNWQWRKIPSENDQIGIAKTSLLFVDSVTEIWSVLLCGNPLVVMNEGLRDAEQLVNAIQQFRVSRVVLVPSLLQAVISYVRMTSQRLDHLKEIICSGETLPLEVAREFFAIFGNKVLMNFYGSTEVTGDATFAIFKSINQLEEESFDGLVPIGEPIDGVSVEIVVNEEGETNVEPPMGEMTVKGPTVSPGYVNILNTQTEYHTGDIATIKNQKLYFLGRKDDQIKIRGNRVNCNEISALIRTSLPETNVVVMVVNAGTGIEEIIAFVEGDDETADKARQVCQSSLPDYMHPTVIFIQTFPLTPNGKIDRQALQGDFNVRRGSKTHNFDAYKPTEKQFLSIVSNVLELPVESISLGNEFVQIGGNSVNKVRLASQLADQGHEFAYRDFILARTIGEMCDIVHGTKDAARTFTDLDDYEVIQADETTPHEYLVQILTDAFLIRDPLVILSMANTEKGVEECYSVVSIIYHIALMEDQGIFMIRRKETGKILGVIVVINEKKLKIPEEFNMPESISLLLEVIGYADTFYDKTSEEVMDFFAWATHRDVTTEENTKLTYLAEEFVVGLARERGYYAVKAENTNPVTQNIAKHLGYETKGSFLLKDYQRADGSKPFYERAPPDTIIKAMIRYLKDE